MDLAQLKSRHKAVARYLATGMALKDICNSLNLSYEYWSSLVNTPLFKMEIERCTEEFEDRLFTEAAQDPVILKLKTLTKKAVTVLEDELTNTNTEDGASAHTRLKAANSVLDRLGYNAGKDTESQRPVVINISADKLGFLEKKLPTELPMASPSAEPAKA